MTRVSICGWDPSLTCPRLPFRRQDMKIPASSTPVWDFLKLLLSAGMPAITSDNALLVLGAMFFSIFHTIIIPQKRPKYRTCNGLPGLWIYLC